MMITKPRYRMIVSLAITCLLATVVGCTGPQATSGGTADANGADGADGTNGASQLPDTVPDFGAATFTNPTQIDNTYLPFVPGTAYTYEAETEDGTERIVVEVLGETRQVAGVTCVVARDRVYLDGVLIEDTHDWYAQDDDGNVWYMGEEVDNYNYDDEGNLIDVDHGGAWETGLDVAGIGATANAGYIMRATPTAGDAYHQEYYEGEAEDMGEVVELDVPVTLSDGTEYTCLKTRDYTPLEPDVSAFKYYAPGVGVVLEEEEDVLVELVSMVAADAEPVPLKEAKLIIEHNATDEDTGFQGFIDSEGWERLEVTGPGGVVLVLEGRGGLGAHGLTELFFETVEPENAELPIDDVLAVLPEGDYTIEGPAVEGMRTAGTATLTHDIPAGPVLLTPAEGATVPASGLVCSWEPVTETITSEPVTIIRYQLIVEKVEDPHPNAIGKIGMSVYVPASVTSVTVPDEFLEPGTEYAWEVLAIEESGNQTLSSSEFATE